MALNKTLLSHMGQAKQIAEKRYEIMKQVIETIANPNEAWQQFYKPQRKQSRKLQTAFLAYYQNTIVVVKAEMQNGILVVITYFESEPNKSDNVSKHRKGILIKK